MEVQFIKSKFTSVDYPLLFIDNLICTFKEDYIVDQNNVIVDNDDEPLIPPCFLKLINVSLCQSYHSVRIMK